MPSIITRLLLFLSSYFPLAAIFSSLLYSRNRGAAITILAIGTMGLVGLAVYLHIVRRKLNPLRVQIVNVRRTDAEAMSYIVTYLLPFLALPSGTIGEGVSLGIFFFMLCVLYVNSDMIHINPMLNLAFYHIYEVELANGDVHALITRGTVSRGEEVNVVQAGQQILVRAD